MRLAAVSFVFSIVVAGDARAIDFKSQVQPIFEARCQPCHFAGGKMYSKLPFDRPATITLLGDKLFTRIKDEKSQTVIRAFIAEQQKRKTSVTHGAPPRR